MPTAAFPGANYETEGFTLTDANETTIYTVPSSGFEGGIQLVELWAADEDGSANTLTIRITLDSTEYTFAYQEAMSGNTPLQHNFTGLVLNHGDLIKLTAGTATIDGYVGFIQNSRET